MCAEGPPPVGLGCDVADQEVGCRRGPLRLAIWCSLPRGGEEKRGGRGGILKRAGRAPLLIGREGGPHRLLIEDGSR